MADHVGKIIIMKNRYPGPPTTATNTVGEGIRKALNLCFVCAKFKPNEAGHCPIAQQHFDFCNQNHMGSIVYRCAYFSPKIGVEASVCSDSVESAT